MLLSLSHNPNDLEPIYCRTSSGWKLRSTLETSEEDRYHSTERTVKWPGNQELNIISGITVKKLSDIRDHARTLCVGNIDTGTVVESMFRNSEDGGHLPSASSCAPQDSFHVSGIPQFFMKRSLSFSGLDRAEDLQPDDDMSDDGSQMLGEKKRRLNLEQVKALEKSFELGNKLEPERKMQLARALGLQPRQVAVWFQNRRARWKTKQLEKDYDVLKRQFEALKSDNNSLKSHNKNLHSQLLALRSKESNVVSTAINLSKENEACWSNGSDSHYEVNLNTTPTDATLYPRTTTTNKNVVVLPSLMEISAPTLSDYFQNHKINNGDHPPSSNHQIFNMLGNIDESQEFWPWHEQQNFQ